MAFLIDKGHLMADMFFVIGLPTQQGNNNLKEQL